MEITQSWNFIYAPVSRKSTSSNVSTEIHTMRTTDSTRTMKFISLTMLYFPEDALPGDFLLIFDEVCDGMAGMATSARLLLLHDAVSL